MKGWFLENGDIELEDGTILHDPIPEALSFNFGGTSGDCACLPIRFETIIEDENKELHEIFTQSP